MCTSHQPTEGADSIGTCPNCGAGPERMPCTYCATYGAHDGPCQHCGHAYPNDAVRRNLDAVRTGAMVHDAGSDAELRRLGLIRVNSAGWYDLTPAGRARLEASR